MFNVDTAQHAHVHTYIQNLCLEYISMVDIACAPLNLENLWFDVSFIIVVCVIIVDNLSMNLIYYCCLLYNLI